MELDTPASDAWSSRLPLRSRWHRCSLGETYVRVQLEGGVHLSRHQLYSSSTVAFDSARNFIRAFSSVHTSTLLSPVVKLRIRPWFTVVPPYVQISQAGGWVTEPLPAPESLTSA